MRFCVSVLAALFVAAFAVAPVWAKPAPVATDDTQVQVTAEESLEYFDEQNLYIARGKAKATRGTMTIEADILTAHTRPKNTQASSGKAGDIETLTAEGHVRIYDPRQTITGDKAVYNVDKQSVIVTGNNLRYQTAQETVTARDSLEYHDDTKVAVARGRAVADQPGRHIEADVLTAEFRDAPNGQTQLTKMTAQGHVSVITKSEVARGDHGVYHADSNKAIVSGDVRVTRSDGTQLSGDVGEVDFNNNASRLTNDGAGRVKALLPPKLGGKP